MYNIAHRLLDERIYFVNADTNILLLPYGIIMKYDEALRLRLTAYHHLASTPCLKNVPHLVCYNPDTCERILIFLAEMLPIK